MRVNQRCITKDGNKVSNGRILSVDDVLVVVCSDCFNIMRFSAEDFLSSYDLAEDGYDITVEDFIADIQANMLVVQDYIERNK